MEQLEKRRLLIPNGWMQAIVIVALCGFERAPEHRANAHFLLKCAPPLKHQRLWTVSALPTVRGLTIDTYEALHGRCP